MPSDIKKKDQKQQFTEEGTCQQKNKTHVSTKKIIKRESKNETYSHKR